MPVRNSYTVPAQRVRYGDTIAECPTRRGPGLKVVSTNRGPKFVTVTLSDHSTVKWARTDEITVTRMEKTKAEMQKAADKSLEVALRRNLRQGVKDTVSGMVKKALKKHASDMRTHGYSEGVLTGWNLSDILAAQETQRVYLAIQETYNDLAESPVQPASELERLILAYAYIIVDGVSRRSGRHLSLGGHSDGRGIVEGVFNWAVEDVARNAYDYAVTEDEFRYAMSSALLKHKEAVREHYEAEREGRNF